MTQLLCALLYLASAAYAAAPLGCNMGADLAVDGTSPTRKCQIIGHSQVNSAKTYYATCADVKDVKQVEYTEAARQAQLVDPTSREEIAKCEVNQKKFNTLIKDYESRFEKLTNPKCYLTQWKGQMMFVANGVKGRCSFNMNKNKSEEFRSKTGVTPLYQCENGYFLSLGEKTAAAVYKKSQRGWDLDCKAAIRVGEPVEQIDWKNPPAYWAPEASALGPNSGNAVRGPPRLNSSFSSRTKT